MRNISQIVQNLFLILGLTLGYPSSLLGAGKGRIPLRPLPEKLYGVTLDTVGPLPEILDALASLSKIPTSRIVFDEWVRAINYLEAVKKIREKSYVVGELLDSSSFSQYTLSQYRARTKDYLNTLGGYVDLWEVGNEINGEWLGKTSAVVAKMTVAFDLVKAQGGRTALTLYYNPNCWSKPSHEMFRWAATNIPDRMKTGLDYVLISYYEEDCNNYDPDWQAVMTKVSALFPNSKVGVGECGTRQAEKKSELINQYYSMKLTVPSFVGGYFWWYFIQDMVPKTKPLWSVLNQSLY